MKIKIHHIDKIEGHMGFEASLYKGNVKEAFVDILEGARLIEGMLRGRPYADIPIISSRVCGVCPVVHNLSAIKALENALGVKVDNTVVLFRKLLMLGEMIQSHVVHVVLLSGPDFLGETNDIKLIKKYPKESELAFKVRDFSVKIMEAVGGRAIHPITTEVGGFKILPTKYQIEEILHDCDDILEASLGIFKFLASKIKLPELKVEVRPVSNSTKDEYCYYGDDRKIISGQGLNTGLEKFYSSIEELQKPKSVVKQTELYNRHYLVGALARMLNQNQLLNKEAKKIFKKLPQDKLKTNPFYNLLAQWVETIHFIEEVKKISEKLLSLNIPRESRQKIELREGEGVGSVEAPRGTLIHYYKVDKDGRIIDSNTITPTAQFLNDLEHSLRAYLPQIKDLPEEERALKIKSLVRAYDPCISCATH
ncbi:Ni/Fe hydrogenase subunit alpha [Patescibacteria group bacterium]